eukprot:TRINITY_DN107603_c0_g1_i1.p1 TRINITY_DN107603_c0_g1~~TRINITY_DN107603_c0_g1_i1.p1  ORF type:complete len:163 (+),score=33.98 TRINITY_DN107603_c0_g1_i1:192-680(+)
MQIYWVAGHHPGYPSVQNFHAWVACAQYLYGGSPAPKDPKYQWFGVAMCMDYGHSSNECETKMSLPATQKAAIAKCTANTTLANQLVKAMETKANTGPGFFPGPYADGRPAPAPSSDNPHQFVEQICNAYTGTKPKACSMTAREVRKHHERHHHEDHKFRVA